MLPSRIVRRIRFACALWIHAAICVPWFADTGTAKEKGGKSESVYREEKCQDWLSAVRLHKIGEPDSSATRIGHWQTSDLEYVIALITRLSTQFRNPEKKAVAKTQLQRYLKLSDLDLQQGKLDGILKHGALLHIDIALLGLESSEERNLRDNIGMFVDGQIFLRPRKLHWGFARRLMDAISPTPEQNLFAKQLYIATTAYLQSRRLYAYAEQNLESALKQFPSDDKLLFYAGVLHEAWAAPINQNIVLPPLRELPFESKEAELKHAREFFQRALAVNPNHGEARLHLGRVLGLLGHHQKAVAEFQRAAALLKDPVLIYYISLCLGNAYERLSLEKEARDQYERAAALYPSAQSPYLALSCLARSHENARGAWAALQKVFALQPRDSMEADPWWSYDISHVRNADSLIEEMKQMFRELPR